MTDRLTLTRPDDWHLHLRDAEALAVTVPPTAAVFTRAVVMPNLTPPVRTVADALAYRARIVEAAGDARFEPLMTLYLTEGTTPEDIAQAAASPHVVAVKLYPAGATTNSEAGVRELSAIAPVLAALEEHDVPLLVHGESIDPLVDVFDREAVFIERTLAPLCRAHPKLRVVFEHITTAAAVAFVEGARAGVAATITPQHLLMNRNHLFEGGLRPHRYCLPVLKRASDQEALARAACSGNPRFFLGTDSAPHSRASKESACGCAGCFSSPAALPLYAEFFDRAGALERLEDFASHHGADFYRLPRNGERITLERRTQRVPAVLDYPGGAIVPFWAGGELAWSLADA